MCRWGCQTTNTTYMCKWCGTRYCRECLKGDFPGTMPESTHCRVCNQKKCQGNRVEYVPRLNKDDEDPKNMKRGASGMRGRSASRSAKTVGSAKSSRSAKSAKSSKSTKSKKSGKKSGKKKKK